MKVADAHCDTILKFIDTPFDKKDAHWNLEKFNKVNGILQYFAVCVLPPSHGDTAFREAASCIGNFWRKKDERIQHLGRPEDFDENKVNVILSLEGATPIIDNISNLYAFYQLGVRAMTLTWNHRNFVADGVDNPFGLTTFGREVVEEMEKLRMIIDVSHINNAGFDDVVKTARVPFAASHSNSRRIFDHPRNLYDDQAKEIINRGGFIGLNFYSIFISDSEDRNEIRKAFARHVEHFMEMGAENTLGLGADFDGMDKTPFSDVSEYPDVENILREDLKLSEEQVEKIMYKNLVDFTMKMI